MKAAFPTAVLGLALATFLAGAAGAADEATGDMGTLTAEKVGK